MRKLKISQRLYEALVNKAMNHFTILELRDACFVHSISNVSTGRMKAYKTAYRQVERLVSKGILAKTKPNDGSVRYGKTEAFYCTEFAIRKVPTGGSRNISDATVLGGNDGASQAMKEQLSALARSYQVDLLTCIGESEEYIRLYSDFPALKAQLEPQYHEARERSSKLLGKIKALDTVLAQLPHITT